ncbi:MAG: hypothetical protein RR979_01410 [Mucinivorans sp.]
MGGFIILGVLITIWFITSATKKRTKDAAGAPRTGSYGENFPFPSEPQPTKAPGTEVFDPWDLSTWTTTEPQKTSPDEIEQPEQTIAQSADEIIVDEIAPIEGTPTTTASIEQVQHLEQPSTKKRAKIMDDFDIRKAVIYSEILKPKFIDR